MTATLPISAPPGTSRMAPEPCQEAEKAERQAALSLADQEPVSDHPEPPAGPPKDPVAPACLKDTKPSSTPVVFPINLRLAPESLDPRTLRLLWGQRELEIQALRWTIRNRQNARHCHILYEVAGLPPESCSHRQEKLLQNQVQKLTLELKGQKEQAQLEKSQLETELQAFQRSCLLQLARSSWVGRVLRSSTGSVEVVTAETLMDSSDLSENDQVPSTGEVSKAPVCFRGSVGPWEGRAMFLLLPGQGFRLEDVDWNSIAHRYPNLLANIKSNSDQKLGPRGWNHNSGCPAHLGEVRWGQGWSSEARASRQQAGQQTVAHRHPWALPSPPAPVPGQWGSELHRECVEQHLKSVEWRSLPSVGTSSSGGRDSDPGSGWLAEPHRVQKVTGQPPCAAGRSSELTKPHGRSFGREMQALPEAPRAIPPAVDLTPGAVPLPHAASGYCSLKIVAVSRKEKFVRILNQSLEETADLGGLTLRQLLYGFPVCMYRFPPGTLLAPGHHLTVWGEGPSSTKKQPPSSLGQEPVHFHSGRGCVTLLLNPKGEVRVLSEHRAPHCVTPVSRIFADNTDLSVDRFPLSEDGLGADPGEQSRGPRHSRAGRVREAGARRRRPGTRGLLPRLSTSKLFRPREVPARPEAAETRKPELLPALPGERTGTRRAGGPAGSGSPADPIPSLSLAEAGLCLEHCGASKEHRVRVSARARVRAVAGYRSSRGVPLPAPPLPSPPLPAPPLPSPAPLGLRPSRPRPRAAQAPPPQVCRRSVDRGCPMVALSVQSTAESRYGFRFLPCPPVTADPGARV
ncbi:lamin tail domain-containing protein 2 isoform X3 [Prionailurus viverrinus]|uniref:lamin tail domain-containing protein 2 isoform X3 n=1 Tax=Prionailurus viverrinus TaxID=61388 RepID=UPI001FF22E09|nr:lamin tail domain-containing protein 2 isoform X3 [Prionailurus viverrinus]